MFIHISISMSMSLSLSLYIYIYMGLSRKPSDKSYQLWAITFLYVPHYVPTRSAYNFEDFSKSYTFLYVPCNPPANSLRQCPKRIRSYTFRVTLPLIRCGMPNRASTSLKPSSLHRAIFSPSRSLSTNSSGYYVPIRSLYVPIRSVAAFHFGFSCCPRLF